MLAHPECTPEVLEQADYIGSTSGIIKQVTESAAQQFIIATEIGVLYQIRQSVQKSNASLFFLNKFVLICAKSHWKK